MSIQPASAKGMGHECGLPNPSHLATRVPLAGPLSLGPAEAWQTTDAAVLGPERLNDIGAVVAAMSRTAESVTGFWPSGGEALFERSLQGAGRIQ